MAASSLRFCAAFTICVCWLAILSAARGDAPPPEGPAANEQIPPGLVPTPPTEPSQALSALVVEPGFRVELAAAEPLIASPVAIDFDEFGRLYVVEMTGYSEQGGSRLGRVRVLDDDNRDGRFDRSAVFADGLVLPTAVLCYDGGVFVGDAPDLLYLRDVDGDDRADERRTIFTGFGTENIQGLLNSFRWGPDNRVYVAVSSCGAELRRGDAPQAKPLSLRGRDFAFDPRTLEVEALSGGGQHGMSFDAWGNRFVCNNTEHIQQVLIDSRDAERNPFARLPSSVRDISAEGSAADIFRISPVEPWRIARTDLRRKGLYPGPLERGGQAAGYFTAATGVTIYTGDAWPDAYRGDAFIGDVSGNLVHRKRLEQAAEAVAPTARRVTPGREFLASPDLWFRPVQFAMGPDGSLYVIDMYREVVEHPEAIPPEIKSRLDLTHGQDRGRLYRVIAADVDAAKASELYARPLPGGATTEEPVAMLAHPNGWHRVTAPRLLFQRRDQDAAASLDKLWQQHPLPEARVQTLDSLASLGTVGTPPLIAAMRDDDWRVRAHALRVAAGQLAVLKGQGRAELETAVLASLGDAHAAVRYRAAWALGEVTDARRVQAIADLLRRDGDDEYIAAAVFCALASDGGGVAANLLHDSKFVSAPTGVTILDELFRQVGARHDPLEVGSVGASIVAIQQQDAELANRVVMNLLRGAGSQQRLVRQQLAAATSDRTSQLIVSLIDAARNVAMDERRLLADRERAIGELALSDFGEQDEAFRSLLEPRRPQELQLAALGALRQFESLDALRVILDSWPGMAPNVRRAAADAIISRGSWAVILVAAIASGEIAAADLDADLIQRLRTYPDASIRAAASQALQSTASRGRPEVIKAYAGALTAQGDFARGRELFRKHCTACHQLEGVGSDVGANLAAAATQPAESLLLSILDPNREVNPKFMQYAILTVDGLTHSGVIADETSAAVTLHGPDRVSVTIPRADIESFQASGMTLMPEGLEQQIDVQGIADLLAYLRNEE